MTLLQTWGYAAAIWLVGAFVVWLALVLRELFRGWMWRVKR